PLSGPRLDGRWRPAHITRRAAQRSRALHTLLSFQSCLTCLVWPGCGCWGGETLTLPPPPGHQADIGFCQRLLRGVARLKQRLHLTVRARPLGQMLLSHPALLDPAAAPAAPTAPSTLEQAPAHSVGCDGVPHAGSAARMVAHVRFWQHWLP